MPLRLTSPAFADGEHIDLKYTRLGDNASPPLEWSGAPEGTNSFAILLEDPDAPGGTFRHWAIYDIPVGTTALAVDESVGTKLPQARNDFGETRYDGPEPPAGHGPHRYRFSLLALAVPSLDLGPDADVAAVRAAAEPHRLEETWLLGLFARDSKDM